MTKNNFLKRFSTVIILVLLLAIFTASSSSFFTAKNFINILRQISVLSILSVGMTFVIISGGMDLSVGSLLGLTGVICAKLIVEFQIHPVLSILATLILLTIVGMFTGYLIVKLNVSAIVITLGMMTVTRGIAYILSGGIPIYDIPEDVVYIGQGYIGPIPVPVITMLVIVGIAAFLLRKTYWGRFIYAIGGNEEATRLAGISVDRIKVALYAISGFLSAIAGITLMARVSSGAPASGTGTEMDVVTAAVIGGISINGGKGTIIGAFVGAMIIGVLSNGLTIMNVGEYYQQVVKGAVLILAVAFDSYSNTDRIKKIKHQAKED
jgi:ribose transport system permease protein